MFRTLFVAIAMSMAAVFTSAASELTDSLTGRSWVDADADFNVTFFADGTCSVTRLSQKRIAERWKWSDEPGRCLIIESLVGPDSVAVWPMAMQPDGFKTHVDMAQRWFYRNITDGDEARDKIFEMCLAPFGCRDFFLLSADGLREEMLNRFPLTVGATSYYGVYLGGVLWKASDVNYAGSRVSYMAYPGDNARVEDLFAAIDRLFGATFKEVRSPMGENTRLFVATVVDDEVDDESQVCILLMKVLGSVNPGSWLRHGYVNIDVRRL